MLSHKTGLDKFQNTEIVQNMFSGHNRIELKINNNIMAGKISKYLEIKSRLISNLNQNKSQGKLKNISK